MHYALNNGAEYSINDNQFDNTEIIDTLIYAIIGKNLNCIKNVCSMYLTTYINENNWERYILFASTFGTIEVLQYLINLNPHLIEQIDELYNKILKYALINTNLDCIKYALNNGAIYNDNMEVFVNEYNRLYSRSTDELDHLDSYDFYITLRTLPDNYEFQLEQNINYIKYRIE